MIFVLDSNNSLLFFLIFLLFYIYLVIYYLDSKLGLFSILNILFHF